MNKYYKTVKNPYIGAMGQRTDRVSAATQLRQAVKGYLVIEVENPHYGYMGNRTDRVSADAQARQAVIAIPIDVTPIKSLDRL